MNKNKTILHLTTVSTICGAERLICDLVKYHNDTGSRDHIIVVVIGPGGMLNTELDNLKCENYSLNVRNFFHISGAILKLLDIIRKNNVSILHTHLFQGSTFGSIIKIFNPSIKLIHTRHYNDIFVATEKNLKRYMIDKYINNIAANKIVAISANVLQTLRDEGAQEDKLIVISDGISLAREELSNSEADSELISNIEKNISIFKSKHKNNLISYSIGGFRKGKGQINILKLINHLRRRDIHLFCLIIGDGEEKKYLEGFCSKHNLNEYVFFTGYLKAPYYYTKECEIFIHLTDFEAFGLVVCEAMREKKLIMASNLGGIIDIIDNEKTGFLTDPGDTSEQTKTFEKILSLSQTERDKIISEANNSFLKSFTIDICYKKYFKLYNSIS